jgi:hypothetical protein
MQTKNFKISFKRKYSILDLRKYIQAQKEKIEKNLHQKCKILVIFCSHPPRPILKMETASYRIEIDCLGEDNYRYRSRKVDAPQDAKPEV